MNTRTHPQFQPDSLPIVICRFEIQQKSRPIVGSLWLTDRDFRMHNKEIGTLCWVSWSQLQSTSLDNVIQDGLPSAAERRWRYVAGGCSDSFLMLNFCLCSSEFHKKGWGEATTGGWRLCGWFIERTTMEWWRFCGSGWQPYCWIFLLLVVLNTEGKGKAVTGFQGCLSTCLIEKESKEESVAVYGGGAWSTKTVVSAGGVWAVGSGKV
ncbi:uncharacterized protein LOC111880087 [Lactuca sativa]|uniref:uncharacterized protein LOC111880087 n=1 Tax=Lactuca sativa TaxID=4236 RepID=UPI0022AF6521|nr:uncharacterized protein LOC111880087 [Lactuca sativa]